MTKKANQLLFFFFLMHGVKKLVWQAKVYLLMNNNDFSFKPAML